MHIEVDSFDMDGVLLVLPGKVEFLGGGGVDQHAGGMPGAGVFGSLVKQVAEELVEVYRLDFFLAVMRCRRFLMEFDSRRSD